MNETGFWQQLLTELRARRFADIEGAEAALVLPVSDRLATELVRQASQTSNPPWTLDIRAASGNIVTLGVSAPRIPFLPSLQVRLEIDQQPRMPESPIVGLRVLAPGLASVATLFAKYLAALPPGVQVEPGRVTIDLARVLERYGFGEVLSYLTFVEFTTNDGRIIVTLRASPPSR